ncbi:MAG: glycine cleavage system protein H [Candidatus Bathyarchaeia archaeon]
MMSYSFPDDLYYTEEHIWVRKSYDSLTLGFDDLAAKLIGNILVVMLANKGTTLVPGTVFGTVESMKWVERLRSPVSGVISEVNHRLEYEPTLVNKDPYGEGWLVKVQPTSNLDFELQRLVSGGDLTKWAEKEVERRTRESASVRARRAI